MPKTYRGYQTERGIEALEMLANYLESKNGKLTVSIHETHYSSGCHGQPDIIYKEYGIEVKRVEIFSKTMFKEDEKYYIHLNNMGLSHQSWNYLKEWCKENSKIPMLVVVMTWGRQKPLFIKFSKEQIDELQKQQRHKNWIQLNAWQILSEGEILK